MYTSPTQYSGVPQVGMPTRISSTVRNPFGSLSPTYATSYSSAPSPFSQSVGVQPQSLGQTSFAPQVQSAPVIVSTPVGQQTVYAPQQTFQGYVSPQQPVGTMRPPTPTAVVTTPLVPIEQSVPSSLSQSPTLFSRPPSMRMSTPLVPSIPVEQAVVSDTSESTLTTPVLTQVSSTPAQSVPSTPAPTASQVSFTPVGSVQPSFVSAPVSLPVGSSPQRTLTSGPTLQSALGNPGITSPTPQRVTLTPQTPSGSLPTSQPQIVVSSPTPPTAGQTLLQQQALSYGQTAYGLQQPVEQRILTPQGYVSPSVGQVQQILTPQGYVSPRTAQFPPSVETGVRSVETSVRSPQQGSGVQLVSSGMSGPITGLTPLGTIQVTTPQTYGTTTVLSQTSVPVIATPPSPPVVPVATTTQIIPPTPLSFAKGSSETLVAAPLSEVGPLMGGRSTPTETVAQGSIENELLAKGYTPISRIAVNQGQDIKGVYIKAVSPIGTIVYIALDAGGILSVTRSDIAETKVGGATSIPYSSKIAAAQCAGLAVCGIAYECKEGVCTLTTDDQGVAKEDLFITTASRSQSIGAFAGDLLPYPIVRLSDIRAAPEQTLENIREVASAIRAKARERLAKDVVESDGKAKALAAAIAEYKERSAIVNDKLQRNLVYLSNLRLTYRGLAESGQLARNPTLMEKASSIPHELKHKQDIYTELLRQDVDMATINGKLDELLATMATLNATAKIWECSADKRASKEGECVV